MGLPSIPLFGIKDNGTRMSIDAILKWFRDGQGLAAFVYSLIDKGVEFTSTDGNVYRIYMDGTSLKFRNKGNGDTYEVSATKL